MTKERLINKTDETLIIEPGEELEIHGEVNKRRVLASRVRVFNIKHQGKRSSSQDER